MKYKKFIALLLVVCLLLNLCGCKPQEEEVPEEPVDPNFPITLEVENDSVTIHEAPTSIVSLSPAITVLFDELGLDDLLDGVSSYAPAEVAAKKDCGTAQNVQLETVKEISPDLLFTDTPLLTEQLTQLQQMGMEVILLPRPESAEEIVERAELILLAVYGKEEGGAKAIEFRKAWEEQWKPLEDAGIAVVEEEKKSVLLLADLDLVATGDSWEGQLLKLMGMNNLADEGKDWQLPQAQTDEAGTVTYLYGDVVVEWNPDVIFYNSQLDVEAIKASELYLNSSAVGNVALYPVDWGTLQLQNGELPEMLGSMVEQVYPDVWELIQDAIEEAKAAEEAAAQEEAENEEEKEG